MSNDIMFKIIEACQARVHATPEWQEWNARQEALTDKIEELTPQLSSDYFDVTWGGANIYSEQMFRLGWEMRANPNALFELADGE